MKTDKKISNNIEIKSKPSQTIKTDDNITSDAKKSVKSQTKDYTKSETYEVSKEKISTKAKSFSPKEEIHSGKFEDGKDFKKTSKPGAYYSDSSGRTISPIKSTHQENNIKTSKDITSDAKKSVKNQTKDYTKSETYEASKEKISTKTKNFSPKEEIHSGKFEEGKDFKKTSKPGSYYSDSSGRTISPIKNVHQENNIKTSKDITSDAKKSVKSQTKDYTKENFYKASNVVGKVSNEVFSKIKSELSQKQDLGSQSAGLGIKTSSAIKNTFKTTQKVTDVAFMSVDKTANTIRSIGKGSYQVATTGGLTAITIARSVKKIKEGHIKLISPQSFNVFKMEFLKSGVPKKELSQKLIHSVRRINRQVTSKLDTVSKGSKKIIEGTKIIKGIIKGEINVDINKKVLQKYVRKIISKNLIEINGNVFKLGKKITKSTPYILKNINPILSIGTSGFSNALLKTDDYALQGVGVAIKTSKLGIQTAIHTKTASTYIIKTSVKNGKKLVKATSFIKNNGLKSAWKASRNHTVKSINNVLKSIIKGLKIIGKKIVIPLIIISVVFMAISGVITIPVAAVASIFGSIFNMKDTKAEHDIRTFLNTEVPILSTNFQNELAKKMEESKKNYNIVRFYANIGTDDEVEPSLSGIKSIFPSNEELNNMIQPIFNSVVLMKYELEPTEKEAKDLTEEIFSKLFTVSTETKTEYCGQDLKTGKGTAISSHLCGSIHAKDDCPNKLTGTHNSHTCSTCCYYTCNGHSISFENISSYYYCNGCIHNCSGYKYCGSHSVIIYNLSVDGIYRLESEYFLTPIEELSMKTGITKEEKEKLSQLKDYHEIFKEIMTQVAANYGGGMKMSDLSGVKFSEGTGSRKKNQEVIDLALSQVGQIGGQPYWSYYGFSKRVEWCACFVNWCMRNTPTATNSYHKTANNAYCQTIANNFQNIGQWGDKNYADLVAGDTIFFDWNTDGHTDHIGLVIGTDGMKVYTVEGNSGDAVKVNSYPIGSSVIYGYGLMNY